MNIVLVEIWKSAVKYFKKNYMYAKYESVFVSS